MKLRGRIVKGNGKGVGFLRPLKKLNLEIGTPISVTWFVKENKIQFFTRIYDYSGLGFYVPKDFMLKYDLLGKKLLVFIKKFKKDVFYSRVDRYFRATIPLRVINDYNLKDKDILLLRVIQGKSKFDIYTQIKKRKNRKEYKVLLGKSSEIKPNRVFRMKIKYKLSNKKFECSKKYITCFDIFDSNEIGIINKNKAIIFTGKANPIIIQPKININKIAFYAGCYLSDGTKVGNHWRINASTFEQAKYYIKMHKFLVKDTELDYRLTYTNINENERGKHKKIKKGLVRSWKREVGINIDPKKIKIREGTPTTRKFNPYGSLSIIENKLAVLIFYNKILKLVVQKILKENNRKLAIDFICGVLEGDGTVNSTKRGHVQISTNKKMLPILERIVRTAGINYRTSREGDRKYSIRVGALEILRNLPILKNKIFIFYAKRRKALMERLNTVGGVRFLLGKQDYASSWVKAWLKNEGILNKKYQLTLKGKKIRNNLLDMMKEVGFK